MTLWAEWWVWALAAIALAVLEVLLPGYVALGFAIGAGLVGLGLLTGVLGVVAGLAGGYAFAVLLLVFAVLSLAAWLVLRRAFGPAGGETRTFDGDVND